MVRSADKSESSCVAECVVRAAALSRTNRVTAMVVRSADKSGELVVRAADLSRTKCVTAMVVRSADKPGSSGVAEMGQYSTIQS